MTAVVDVAGAGMGGAARWVGELDAYLAGTDATTGAAVRKIGLGRGLTPAWLVRREWLTGRAGIVVAANNVSFAAGGGHRRVLVRNALHFLHPSEEGLLAGMPRSYHIQVHIVRTMLRRADMIVAPSSAMAARVAYHLPSAAGRIVVRPHPVTPAGPRVPSEPPYILVPVLPAPYKNLVPQLRLLLQATANAAAPVPIRVTARSTDLPEDLAGHPRLTALGTLTHAELAHLWRSAAAAFFPSAVESFGYPLAEARAYGVAVLSPDSEQAREIAAAALLPYDPDDVGSLAAAVERIGEPVTPDPRPFDAEAYFGWLFELGQGPHNQAVPCTSDYKSGRGTLFSQ